MDRKPRVRENTSTVENAGDFWLSRAAREQQARAPRGDALVPEPRVSLRRRIPLEVLVNYGMTYSVPWRVRDLSLHGAFVEMDAADLQEGSYVEFVLRYRYKDKAFEHRLPAKIARLGADGVALEFGDYDDATYTDLVNLLYAI
jgi:hypothetical protein